MSIKPASFLIIGFLLLVSVPFFGQDNTGSNGNAVNTANTDTTAANTAAPDNSANADNMITADRGTIPDELLRPRLDEAPRYAIDVVIGSLGQGDAPEDAYNFASAVAADLVKGDAKADSLKAMNNVLLESYLSVLQEIGPRNFRLGGGKIDNDGSVSFLVRFIGRELAITGELYVRLETPVQLPPPPPPPTPPQDVQTVPQNESADNTGTAENADASANADAAVSADVSASAVPAASTDASASAGTTNTGTVSAKPKWIFEDLILENSQTRKEENDKAEQRFDFSPYHRFY
ncbi:MAG: hypothetical protein FWF29_00640 [Treponema sp.]|nr:hypothetical protein [Treponema sp.]